MLKFINSQLAKLFPGADLGRRLFALCGLLAIGAGGFGVAQAAVNVAGPITTSTTWTLANSPYTVTADVSVDSGSTLTIDAGVVVLFNAGTNFIVNNGSVVAKGTAAQVIVLTSAKDVAGAATAPAAGDWGQLRFTAGTISASTEFDNVQIRYGTGVTIVSSSPTINRLAITNCAGPAITVDLLSSPKGVGLTATGNTINGIRVPAGNILGNLSWSLVGIPYVVEIGEIGVGAPASITSISPGTVQAGQVVDATITGTRLDLAESVVIDRTGVTAVIQAGATASSVPVKITASDSATAGTGSLTLQVAAGLVSVPLTITAPKPIVSIVPNPIAIPPDGSARSFSINLSRSDSIDYAFTVTSDNPSIAAVSAASASIVAGQTRIVLTVSGIVAGQTTLRVASTSLASVAVPVYVTTEFAGLNTSYSALVGVQVGPVQSANAGSYDSLLMSKAVGVNVGAALDRITPPVAIVGTSSVLTLQGVGFPSTMTVALLPPDGIVLGSPTVAADGNSAQVAVNVGANAVTGLRQVVLRASNSANSAAINASRADADRLLISQPTPQIDSVSPQFGRAGDSINPFIIRGRNLVGVQSLNFLGGDFVVSTSFTVSADGTELRADVSIPANASAGPRTVVVRAPAGDSASTADVSNTFTVVSQITNYEPIVSALVGVNVGQAATAVTATYSDLASTPVGVTVGAGIARAIPRTGATGQTMTLRLQGSGLSSVNSVVFNPATGITAGTLVAAADGSSVDIPLVIAADAPLAPRALTVSAGAQKISFANALDGVFTVTAPQPVLDSVSPIVLVVGTASNTLTLRGRNFQGATLVNISPPSGLSISAPTVNAAGDVATVNVAVAANATLGDHIVSIVAAAGESDLGATPNNTLKVLSAAAQTYDPIVSPSVGVQVGPVQSTATSYDTQLFSALVGVTIPVTAVSSSATFGLITPNVAVNVGAVAYGMDQAAVIVGTTANIAVQGVALPANSTVSVVPATGLTLAAPVVSADGTQLTVAITAAANAPTGVRALQLKSGTADVPFQRAAAATFVVSAGAPVITSVSPITAKQGEVVVLTIRGSNLTDLLQLTTATDAGFSFDSQPTVASDGTQITVKLRIESSATLGASAIQVKTAAGQTSATASPSNTFTVTVP